jgi:hypothetical protein
MGRGVLSQPGPSCTDYRLKRRKDFVQATAAGFRCSPPAKATKLNLTGHKVYKTGIVTWEYAVQ